MATTQETKDRRAKLSQTYLTNIDRPASGTVRVMDTEVRGLCAYVGTKSIRFYLRRMFFGSNKPIKIGEFPAMTVAQAREAANSIIAQAAAGGKVSDAVSTRRQSPTLGDALGDYIQFRLTSGKRLKESTAADMRRRMGYLGDWMDRRIVDIGRKDVSERHAKLTEESGPTTANIVMRYLSAVLNWASDHYAPNEDSPLLAANPVQVLRSKRQWNVQKRLQTFVESSRLPALWEALHALPENAERWKDQAEIGRDFFLFCLFTGMRPGEAARLRVDSVSLEKMCFVLQDSKNHTDFHLPFSGFVGNLLRRRVLFSAQEEKAFVFPSMGLHGKTETINLRRYTSAISEAVGGFVPNDMRRTYATILANLDPPVSHLTTKRLLNHVSVVVDSADVTAGYFGTDIDRLRPVVERISAEILRLCGQSLPPKE